MENISGLEFIITSNEGGGGGIELAEDEWYPAVLVEFTEQDTPWGKSLRWNWELQGEEFTWTSKDGNSGQFRVSGNTSFAHSPKSKMYKWYSKIKNQEPQIGEKISLKSLIGIPCFVMLKKSEGKGRDGETRTYYNVEKVKHSPQGISQISPALKKPIPQQQPKPVKESTGFVKMKEEAIPQPKIQEQPQSQTQSQDIFDNVFEGGF